MTSKEFFVHTVKDELPRFRRFFEAVPSDNLDYRPHERQKSTGEMNALFTNEIPMIAEVLKTGTLGDSFGSARTSTPAETRGAVERGLEEVAALAEAMPEAEWDSTAQLKMGDKVMWETSRGAMAWSFLLDLIHHRGQLSTYIRPMGGKVPAIYGPSGDSTDTGM